jgi:hypothetical protein
VSVEDVRCVGMIKTNNDPRMLASQLAQKAQRRRERARMRMDDITVIVVDVNPNSYVHTRDPPLALATPVESTLSLPSTQLLVPR